MSFDRDERTRIFGYRRLFTTAGLVVGTLLPAMVIRWIGDETASESVARARSMTSLLMAVPVLLTAWITVRSTRGLDESAHEESKRAALNLTLLLRSQWTIVRSPVFLPILLAFFVAGLGRTINASTALYYYEYRLGVRESDTILRILLPFFGCILLSIPAWVWASKRYGKRWPAVFGSAGLGVLVTVAYSSLPAGHVRGAIVYAVLAGMFGGALVLLESLVADVVDYDELKTKHQREGLYFGVWKMGNKLSRALGLVLTGLALSAIGFDESAVAQSAAVSWRLALLFGPGVGGFLILGGVVLAFAPLTDAKHRRVQALLSRRRLRARN